MVTHCGGFAVINKRQHRLIVRVEAKIGDKGPLYGVFRHGVPCCGQAGHAAGLITGRKIGEYA
ncbi:hypothetical protein DENIS_0921 [Desulfonema ishimotonii]|uniref:Uncharacterized protein n=1 Tax=Desulfonema ishimotonii TaxID=45657 RepID=A0A401FSN5_9BACT|nr:hypothetical protein DENIS_0921 [Desulfonema ishimotonii]